MPVDIETLTGTVSPDLDLGHWHPSIRLQTTYVKQYINNHNKENLYMDLSWYMYNERA